MHRYRDVQTCALSRGGCSDVQASTMPGETASPT